MQDGEGLIMETTTTYSVVICPHCGSNHNTNAQCPKIKAIEYHENGTIKRVEYFAPKDYMPSRTIPNGVYPPYEITSSETHIWNQDDITWTVTNPASKLGQTIEVY